jgi:hypothetical protein
MKKSKLLITSFFLSCNIAPLVAIADPTGIRVDINCPNADSNYNQLIRFSDNITGYGMEVVEGHEHKIYFKSSILSSTIPESLNTYRNRDISYSASNGVVTCNYISMNPHDDEFTLSYQLVNAQGGKIIAQNNKQLSVELPIGLHK